MRYKPYEKVITTKDYYGSCAIYEPQPFRNGAIKDAVEQSGHLRNGAIKDAVEQSGHTYNIDTDINDDEWCWLFYDYCGNPIGWSYKKPEGITVEKFTKENLYDNESLAEYLNKEPFFENGK